MHIYFSGIGGSGIGPIALIAKEAGFEVSGSDKQESEYTKYLRKQGIKDIYIGQTYDNIEAIHKNKPIDWFVYSSAVEKENQNHPELKFVTEKNIKHSKRDLFLSYFIKDKQLKLLGIAGTHGKTTTTAMTAWLIASLQIPTSWIVPAKISFGQTGRYDPRGEYLILECDEFDHNFLAFSPYLSMISGIGYDHQEIYSTESSYREAFRQFIGKSAWKILWQSDFDKLGLEADSDSTYIVLNDNDEQIKQLTLLGEVNRRNAWLVIKSVHQITKEPIDKLIWFMNKFPGLSRRMEQIKKNLFTDYAHTPEKIAGAISTGLEIAKSKNLNLVVVYEPLTNRRMHFTKEQHKDLFNGVSKLYWVPSYLAREDPNQPVLTPAELIEYLNPETKAVAQAAELNGDLKKAIKTHRKDSVVLCLSGGGGKSLDEWLRQEFKGWFK